MTLATNQMRSNCSTLKMSLIISLDTKMKLLLEGRTYLKHLDRLTQALDEVIEITCQ